MEQHNTLRSGPCTSRRAALAWTLLLGASTLVLGCRGTSGFGPNLGSGGLALDGRDPVSYFEAEGARPEVGLATITAEHEGATYRFASAERRAAFLENPARYSPAYGGWCAYAMADGEKVEVDPEAYLVEDGRLLLFYDGLWGDTRQMWLDEGPSELRARADAAWARLEEQGEPRR